MISTHWKQTLLIKEVSLCGLGVSDVQSMVSCNTQTLGYHGPETMKCKLK